MSKKEYCRTKQKRTHIGQNIFPQWDYLKIDPFNSYLKENLNTSEGENERENF